MKTLHKNLLIAASLFLLAGAGCTNQTSTNATVNADLVANTSAVSDDNVSVDTENTAQEDVDTNTAAVNENTNATMEASDISADATSEVVDTSNWLAYSNEEYGFSVSYPENWSIMSEYDFESQEIILNDESTAFWLTATSQLSKQQDFTPGISIQFKTDEEVEMQIKEYNDNNEGLLETKIGKYSATVYNKLNIVYENVTIVPEKNLIIRVRTDENFVVAGIFQDIYESVQLD